MGRDSLIDNKRVHTWIEILKIQKPYTSLLKKNIFSIIYVLDKRCDDTYMFLILHNITSDLRGLLLQPFSMTSYLLNLLCHLSYLIMEQGIISNQYLVIGC